VAAEVSWAELRRLPAWTPLTALPWLATPVDGPLFQLSTTQYLLCPPYDEKFQRAPNVPGFVAALLWAPHEGAARRVTLLSVEADDPLSRPAVEPPPPREMLLCSECDTYGAIVSHLEAAHSAFTETATYRIASDGAFVHRTLNALSLTFFFRSRKESDDERCYAIQYRLPRQKPAA
jgi:hypothetical protein